ncbi:SUKH-4 family immunity protein [Kitasatospora sp. NPDC088134]|uniref:SUKH-4 family immunity protein n=1 Tax=Kitasatospora sp. NPDC088134 TaxID=3364071 RepID=UPI0037F6C9C2
MTSDAHLPPVRPVTRAELEHIYGPDGLTRVPDAELPAVITDPAARTFLSDIGLPSAVSAVVLPVEPPLISLSEACEPDGPATYWPTLPGAGSTMVVVGAWGRPVFALDGATGEVYALLANESPTVNGRPAHRSLHSFVRAQLAFGAKELYLLSDLMDPDSRDWCRAHVPGFAELVPVPEYDEDGEEIDPTPEFLAGQPEPDDVLDGLTAALRAIEPDLPDHPAWAFILSHYRYGY